MSASPLHRSEAPREEPQCRMCGAGVHFLDRVDSYPFFECPDCRFIFTPSIPKARTDDPGRGTQDPAPAEGWADERFLEPALARLDEGRRLSILDFGAGDSRVPDLLRARGHRVIGVDLVAPARPHPDRLTGPLESLGLPVGTFDLVYAFQVFEHLPDPAGVLAELLRLTRDGGLVLIHTDMEVDERPRNFAEWWYVLPPDHCSFYHHRTFEVYCQETPHRLVWTDPKRVIIEAGCR